MTTPTGTLDGVPLGGGDPMTDCWHPDSGVSVGTQVIVKDGNGTIIGTGELGTWKEPTSGTCSFDFTVPDVRDVAFYSVVIGDKPALTFSRAEMDTRSWHLAPLAV